MTAGHIFFRQTFHSYFLVEPVRTFLLIALSKLCSENSGCFFKIQSPRHHGRRLAILFENLFATSGFPELYAVNILEEKGSRRYGTVRNDSAGRTGFVGISPRDGGA